MDTQQLGMFDILCADARGNTLFPDGMPLGMAAHIPLVRSKSPDLADRGAPNDLSRQRWGIVAPEGDVGDAMLRAIEELRALREREQKASPFIYRVPPKMNREAARKWWNETYYDSGTPRLDRPAYLLVMGNFVQASRELQIAAPPEVMVGRLYFADMNGYTAYARKVAKASWEPATRRRADVEYAVPHDYDGLGRVVEGGPLDRAWNWFVSPSRQAIQAESTRAWSLRPVRANRPSSFAALASSVNVEGPTILTSIQHCYTRFDGRADGGWPSLEHELYWKGTPFLAPGEAIAASSVVNQPFLPNGVWVCIGCCSAGSAETPTFFAWACKLREMGVYPARLVDGIYSLTTPNQPSFIASVPQAALMNPEGPLAFIGHVDLACCYTYQRHPEAFVDLIGSLASGNRIGVALGAIRDLRARLSLSLLAWEENEEDRAQYGWSNPMSELEHALLRLSAACSAGYMLIGDPAVRLPVSEA